MKSFYLTVFSMLLFTTAKCQDQYAIAEPIKTQLQSEETFIATCPNFLINEYEMAKKRIVANQNFNFYYNKAWQYVNKNGEKSYDAVVNFEQAIKRNPTNGGPYSDLGNCYRGGFQCFSKAKYNYSKAIELGYTEGFVYYNRAICYYELKQFELMNKDLTMAKNRGWNSDPYNLSGKMNK